MKLLYAVLLINILCLQITFASRHRRCAQTFNAEDDDQFLQSRYRGISKFNKL